MENKEEKLNKKPKKSLTKRLLKVFLYIFTGIVALNLLLYVLFSIPFIQNKAKDFAVDELKTKLNTEISIDGLRLTLFNHIILKGIYVEDLSKDTLLYAKTLDARLSPWEFIKNGKLAITGVDLDDFVIKVNQKDSVSAYNYQFIVDAFASKDTVKTDTTKSSLLIVIQNIELKRGRFAFETLSRPQTPKQFNVSHIIVSDLNLKVDLNSLNPDEFDIQLYHLSAKEQSGLIIKELKGHFYSEKSRLWIDGLKLETPNSHLYTQKAEYNLKSNVFTVETDDTKLLAKDFQPFLYNLKFLPEDIILKTSVSGNLPALTINTIDLKYGESFSLQGNAAISNVTKYFDADIHLQIDKLKTNVGGITSLVHLGDSTFVAPSILKTLGDIVLKGDLNGRFGNFKVDAEAWTKQGAVDLVAKGNADRVFNDFKIVGDLHTSGFNLSHIASDSLGRVAAHAYVNLSKSNNKGLSVEAKGNINSIYYNREEFKDIYVDAFYNPKSMGGTVKLNSRLGDMEARVDMEQKKMPDIKLDMSVKSFAIDHFYSNQSWKNPKVSFNLNGNIQDLSYDLTKGKISIDSLHFKDDNFDFKPGSFSLDLKMLSDSTRYVGLNSSILSGAIQGQYRLSEIPDQFINLMNHYLPSVIDPVVLNKKNRNKNIFTIDLTLNNTEELTKIFELPVSVIKPMNVKIDANMITNNIVIHGFAPHLRFGEMDIKQLDLDITNDDSEFNISGGANLPMEVGGYGLTINLDGQNDKLFSKISINSYGANIPIHGSFDVSTFFARDNKDKIVSMISLYPSTVSIKNVALDVLPGTIIIRNNRFEIDSVALGLDKKRFASINGAISSSQSDSLNINVEHAQIGNILSAFEIPNIKAELNGNIKLTNAFEQPEFYTTGFKVNDIIMYGDTLGTMNVDSHWNSYINGIQVAADLGKNDNIFASIFGMVYPDNRNLDLVVHADNFPIDWAQPFVSDLLNKLSGTLSTNLWVKGDLSTPEISGMLGLNNVSVGVDYNNVVYTISDTIQISPNKIGFKDIVLKDPKGNIATIDVSLSHNKFSDMRYSVNGNLKNLMVLNTANRTDSLFFGSVYASGNIKIEGDTKKIRIDLKAKNDKNSMLNIQIPQTSVASDYQSVVYINTPEQKSMSDSLSVIRKSASKTNLSLSVFVDVDVDPNLDLTVLINPKTGDMMHVKGSGEAKFNYDLQADKMNLTGEYVLSEGNVKLNLQNISKPEFTIKEGSKLLFLGDPLKTKFQITAYKRVKASLTTLDPSFQNEDISSKVDVNCVLKISGDLDKMDLSYEIELPNESDDIKQRVASLITTDEHKIQQFAYLLVANRFRASEGGTVNSITEGMWTNIAGNTIASGLDAAFANIFGDKLEIGTNIDSNDGTLSDVNVSVNVSKKFFDDKLRIKTNLGYRNTQTTTHNNNIIGDFDVEYAINKLWTLSAYNHTNDQFYKQATTTQGVGITYSKEASTLKRLFQSIKPRRRNQRLLKDIILQPLSSDSIERKRNEVLKNKSDENR